jgi:hypothetical protein
VSATPDEIGLPPIPIVPKSLRLDFAPSPNQYGANGQAKKLKGLRSRDLSPSLLISCEVGQEGRR